MCYLCVFYKLIKYPRIMLCLCLSIVILVQYIPRAPPVPLPQHPLLLVNGVLAPPHRIHLHRSRSRFGKYLISRGREQRGDSLLFIIVCCLLLLFCCLLFFFLFVLCCCCFVVVPCGFLLFAFVVFC